jgi:hypothetical protein
LCRATCIVLLCLLVTLAAAAPPSRLTGKVVSVYEGETVTVFDA